MSDLAVAMIVDQLRRKVSGGIGTYTRGLLDGVAALGVDVTLVAGRGPSLDPRFPTRVSGLPSPLLTRVWDRGLGSHLVGPVDVVHAVSLATPYPARVPVVVMVHDLAWREVPAAYPRRGREWHERALERCLARAAAIIAPSARTASLIGDDRVVVIPEGADHLPPPDVDGCASLLSGLGVATPFILSVSTLEPRKNLVRLMSGYARIRDRLPEPWPLLVVGPPGWGPSVQPPPGAMLTGMVSDAILSALYSQAQCVAYVPIVEGWGLPAVEAMRAGAPVVASPMPSTGGAALEVDPLDVDAIGEGILAAVGPRRPELVAAGAMRAGSLTWSLAARAHVAVWEAARAS